MVIKQFLSVAIGVIVLINVSVFGTLMMVNIMAGPSLDEIATLKALERTAVKQGIYDQLTPVATFKSKANYISAIGEAALLCESRLKNEVVVAFSHAVNMIESRYLQKTERYKIYIYYATAASAIQRGATFKVSCVVSAETKLIERWDIDAE
ncbi:MAG: hypothetical protein ACI80S_002141 [Pseudohongiellaceae bacterium]|jgi:hypothetical protein